MVMEQVVLELNPTAAETDDAHPSQQVPHLTLAYLLAVGEELGFRGVAAARVDANAPHVGQATKATIKAKIIANFSCADVVEAVVADVNQQTVATTGCGPHC